MNADGFWNNQEAAKPIISEMKLLKGVIEPVESLMREVEDWWIDADFPDDKLSIIERLKAVAQGMS